MYYCTEDYITHKYYRKNIDTELSNFTIKNTAETHTDIFNPNDEVITLAYWCIIPCNCTDVWFRERSVFILSIAYHYETSPWNPNLWIPADVFAFLFAAS